MPDSKTSFSIDPKSTALIVVDMQNAFLTEDSFLAVHMGIEVIPKLKSFIDKIRSMEIPVVYTRGVCLPDGSDLGVLRELFPGIESRPLNQEGTPGAEIHPVLRPGPKDLVITKRRFSAFYCTDLELMLRTRRIDTLILTGVMTNVCVESTARDALFRDFKTVIVSDLTGAIATVDGSMSARDVHAATLKMFDRLYGYVFSSDEVLAKIKHTLY